MASEAKTSQCFRLFSYLAMAIMSIAIMVGLFLIFQHIEEDTISSKTMANQDTLLENQQILKKIIEENEETEKDTEE